MVEGEDGVWVVVGHQLCHPGLKQFVLGAGRDVGKWVAGLHSVHQVVGVDVQVDRGALGSRIRYPLVGVTPPRERVVLAPGSERPSHVRLQRGRVLSRVVDREPPVGSAARRGAG